MFAKAGTGNPAMAALRNGDYKLVYFPIEDRHELYKVSSDVAESKDLSSQEPERADRMKKTILSWRDELGIAPLDSSHNFHKMTLKLMRDAGLKIPAQFQGQ